MAIKCKKSLGSKFTDQDDSSLEVLRICQAGPLLFWSSSGLVDFFCMRYKKSCQLVVMKSMSMSGGGGGGVV